MKPYLSMMLSFLLIALLSGCQKKQAVQQDVLARVGDRVITAKEFREFYELDPNFAVDTTGYPALLNEMDKQIDQVLAMHRGKSGGLLDDSTFIKARNWERRQAMLRQLYRKVIEKDITIGEAELRAAFQRDNIRVHVRHLFSRDRVQVQQWYMELKQGHPFSELALAAFHDTLLQKNSGDLGWMKLGDLDGDFAAGIESLRQGEISQPVRTRWGYHIIQLIDRQDQVMLPEEEFLRQKTSLLKKVKQRKAAELSDRYIANLMRDRSPQPDQEAFRRIWQVAAAGEEEKAELSTACLMTNELIRRMETELKPYLDDPFIRYKGGEIALGEYLQRLKEVPVSNRPRFRTPRQLSDKIAAWLRDEFLLPEAEKRDLQDHPIVEQEVRDFTEEQCYLHFLYQTMDQITVSPDVKAYFSSKDKAGVSPDRHLKKFNTLQEWTWWQAQQTLHKELQELSVPVTIDSMRLREESQQIDWKGRIRMFAVRKPD